MWFEVYAPCWLSSRTLFSKLYLFLSLGIIPFLGLASILGVWDLTFPAFVIDPWLGISAKLSQATIYRFPALEGFVANYLFERLLGRRLRLLGGIAYGYHGDHLEMIWYV